MKKLILVSNDDGVYSQGLRLLTRALKKIPNARVVVVAPDREQSAKSHSLTIHRPIRYEKISKDVFAVDGTPTDCIVLAINEILKCKPDLVVSGINRGANLGEDVHYSGTVSAAKEAVLNGVSGVALSLVLKGNHKQKHFQPASEFALKLIKKVLLNKIPEGIMLNVNIPNLPRAEMKGVTITKLGGRNYGALIVDKIDPRGRKYYWITGDETAFQNIVGSDCNAVLDKKISITPMTIDITSHQLIPKLKQWKL